MPRVKKLRVVSLKYRKQFRDRYYSSNNERRQQAVNNGTYKKGLQVTIKEMKSRAGEVQRVYCVNTVGKISNPNNDEGSKIYMEYSDNLHQKQHMKASSRRVVNQEEEMGLADVTPGPSGSGPCFPDIENREVLEDVNVMGLEDIMASSSNSGSCFPNIEKGVERGLETETKDNNDDPMIVRIDLDPPNLEYSEFSDSTDYDDDDEEPKSNHFDPFVDDLQVTHVSETTSNWSDDDCQLSSDDEFEF